jgi:hypothetical protein
MPDLVIHGIHQDLMERLEASAKSRGLSVQNEVKALLERQYGRVSMREALARAERIREGLGREFTDTTDLIREDRAR